MIIAVQLGKEVNDKPKLTFGFLVVLDIGLLNKEVKKIILKLQQVDYIVFEAKMISLDSIVGTVPHNWSWNFAEIC